MQKTNDPRWPFLRFEPADPTAKLDSAESRNRIVSNDDEIDIFSIKPIPTEFKDIERRLFEVEDFESYTRGVCFLDIETLGLNPLTAEIVAVGLRVDGRNYIACNPDRTEADLLRWFFDQIEVLAPHTVATYNGYNFDFGYMAARMELHGLTPPWRINSGWPEVRWTNTSVFGRPIVAPNWVSDRWELIDLYPEVAKDDFVTKRLDSLSLKNACIGWGLREDRRLEIGAEVREYWARAKAGDTESLELLKEYLGYDLEDTEAVWNYTVPASYYQKEFLPMSTQKHCCTGNGSKWNRLLLKEYPGNQFEAEPKLHFKGGLTGYKAGVFRNVSKIDVASLYPTVMLLYGIHSWKDHQGMQLRWLSFLRESRLKQKSLAGKWEKSPFFDQREKLRVQTPQQADSKQGSAKVFINSGYGFLGVTGLPMNDMFAAAAVTAYGRAVLNFMREFVEALEGTVVGCDTDAICFYSENIERNIEIYEALQAALPEGIEIEHEWIADAIFTPPSDAKIKAGLTLDGLSKNYIYKLSHHSINGKSAGKTKVKGRFAKRDKSIFEKTFQADYVDLLVKNGPAAAEQFYLDTRSKIEAGVYPVENLRATKLISKAEKQMPLWGFPCGTKPTLHYTWRGEYKGIRKPKPLPVPTEDPTEAYYPPYYLEKLDAMYKELHHGGWVETFAETGED